MGKYFDDFDFTDFWDDDEYSLENYVGEPVTDELIRSVEEELGYELPESYIELMRLHNGGVPLKNCFLTSTPTTWAEDHIQISGFLGIGRTKPYSLCGAMGSRFMMAEWDYPDYGVYICDTPSGGHHMVLLDYRKCGREGEPQVAFVDQGEDMKIIVVADRFDSFVRGLVSEDVLFGPDGRW